MVNMEIKERTKKSGQLILPMLHSEVHKTADGIEMGVLENGMPYLSQRGLVKMSGIARTSFQNLSSNWKEEKLSGVGLAINKLLLEAGYENDELFIEIQPRLYLFRSRFLMIRS